MHYNQIQYNTMHYNQIQYNTMQNNEIPWNKMMMMMTIGTKFEIERLNCHPSYQSL